jgi:hypothetical protein
VFFLLRLIKVRHEDKRRGVAGIVGEPDLNARHPGSGTERKRRKIELITWPFVLPGLMGGTAAVRGVV